LLTVSTPQVKRLALSTCTETLQCARQQHLRTELAPND
jgi:hypothetical protein